MLQQNVGRFAHLHFGRIDAWLRDHRHWLPLLLLPILAMLSSRIVGELPGSIAELSPWLLAPVLILAIGFGAVTLLFPELFLIGSVLIGFSMAGATLHIYYGVPLLDKYLPLLLTLALAAQWILSSGHWLVPDALHRERRNPDRDRRTMWLTLSLVGLYYLSTLLSTLYADNQSLASDQIGSMYRDVLGCVTVAWAVAWCGRFSGLRWLTQWAVWATAIALLLAIIGSMFPQYQSTFPGFTSVHISGEAGTVADRIAGTYGHPNTLGRYAVLGMPIALAVILVERGLQRLVAMVCLLIMLVGMVLSESRGALLVLMALLVPGVWLVRHRIRPLYLVLAAAACVVAVALMWPRLDTERLERTIVDIERMILEGEQPTDEATRGRLSEMQVALNVWEENPLLGIGLANYEHRFQMNSYNAGTKLYNADRGAHSLYLELLAERGLVGLFFYFVSFGGILGLVFFNARRHMEQYPKEQMLTYGLCAAFVVYLLSSVFLHDIHAGPMWMLLGLMIGSTKYNSSAKRRVVGVDN